MHLKFLAFLVLIAAKGIVAQQCKLTARQMDKRWIYATNNSANRMDLLHTDFLENQQKLYLICNETFSVTSVCNRGTLQPPVPPTHSQCKHRLKGTVELHPAPNDCYANKMIGKLYQVHYKWSDGSSAFLYDVCYSQRNEAALYARHHAYGFNLPSPHEGPAFTMDGVVSKQRADSFYTDKVYDTFKVLLGPGQTYVRTKKQQIIDRGHLANKNDFLTYDQMDETFKLVNVVPQFKGSNNGNWKRIEEWTHKLPANKTFASVVSGMHDILKLQSSHRPKRLVSMYLMARVKKNPIPLWTYKVVEYQKRCYAFVTLNNDFNQDAHIKTDICKPVGCPSDLKLNTTTKVGISYCCDYHHMVKRVGPHVHLC